MPRVQEPRDHAVSPADIAIEGRRTYAPGLLCQIGNALAGELTLRFVVVIQHRSSLLSLCLKAYSFGLACW
jgi:hypothetical protein